MQLLEVENEDYEVAKALVLGAAKISGNTLLDFHGNGFLRYKAANSTDKQEIKAHVITCLANLLSYPPPNEEEKESLKWILSLWQGLK
jgi:hypothetical protein